MTTLMVFSARRFLFVVARKVGAGWLTASNLHALELTWNHMYQLGRMPLGYHQLMPAEYAGTRNIKRCGTENLFCLLIINLTTERCINNSRDNNLNGRL